MIRRPPRSTRTDTLCPYTTLFRSVYAGTEGAAMLITGEDWLRKPGSVGQAPPGLLSVRDESGEICPPGVVGEIFFAPEAATRFPYVGADPRLDGEGRMSLGDLRSEEPRVGTECVSTGESRGSPH